MSGILRFADRLDYFRDIRDWHPQHDRDGRRTGTMVEYTDGSRMLVPDSYAVMFDEWIDMVENAVPGDSREERIGYMNSMVRNVLALADRNERYIIGVRKDR